MHLQEVTSWERPLLKITKITIGTATVVLLSIVFECNLSRTSAVTHWVHLEEPTSLLEAEQTLASLLVIAVFFTTVRISATKYSRSIAPRLPIFNVSNIAVTLHTTDQPIPEVPVLSLLSSTIMSCAFAKSDDHQTGCLDNITMHHLLNLGFRWNLSNIAVCRISNPSSGNSGNST